MRHKKIPAEARPDHRVGRRRFLSSAALGGAAVSLMGAGRPLADTPGPAGAGTSACELSAVESLAMSDLFLHDVSFGPICALQESVVDRAVSLEAEYRMLLGLVEKLQK